MRRQSDTNPHFVRPFQTQDQDQHPQTAPVGPVVPLPYHHGQSEPLSHGPTWLEPEPQHNEPPPDVEPARRRKSKHQGRRNRPPGPLVSFQPHPEDRHPQPKDQGQQSQLPVPSVPIANHNNEDQNPHMRTRGRQALPLGPPVPIAYQDHADQQHPRAKHQGHKTPPVLVPVPISNHDIVDQPQHKPHGSLGQPHQHNQRERARPQGLLIPHPQQTNLFTWSAAIFCAIFWVVIIIAGLVVLIVYLVFRPRTPKFDVSTATLNAAYLDMGYLLNADVTVLANFTNPNKKVRVDFSYLIIDLYYGNTLIATQYVEPFTAQKSQSMFANVHMVVSQVRLGLLESQRLKRQMESNRAVFEVKGTFRARANFGKILRYSYWLHGDCKVVFSRPPDGVLVSRKCKTKH